MYESGEIEMPFGWLTYFSSVDVDEKPERRVANRPHRGNRAKVKAARKAHRAGRR